MDNNTQNTENEFNNRQFIIYLIWSHLLMDKLNDLNVVLLFYKFFFKCNSHCIFSIFSKNLFLFQCDLMIDDWCCSDFDKAVFGAVNKFLYNLLIVYGDLILILIERKHIVVIIVYLVQRNNTGFIIFLLCFWIFGFKMIIFWYYENGISEQPNGCIQKFQAGYKFNIYIQRQSNIIHQFLVIL